MRLWRRLCISLFWSNLIGTGKFNIFQKNTNPYIYIQWFFSLLKHSTVLNTENVQLILFTLCNHSHCQSPLERTLTPGNQHPTFCWDFWLTNVYKWSSLVFFCLQTSLLLFSKMFSRAICGLASMRISCLLTARVRVCVCACARTCVQVDAVGWLEMPEDR